MDEAPIFDLSDDLKKLAVLLAQSKVEAVNVFS